MPDFLDEKRDEIEARLAELEPLVNEYNRLRAAADALAGVDGAGTAQQDNGAEQTGRSTVAPAPAYVNRPTSPDASRPAERPVLADTPASADAPASFDSSALSKSLADAPAPLRRDSVARERPARRAGRPKGSGMRGAEALKIVREQPGVTIPELADRMGIKQNYLYRVLPELVQEGKVAKQGRGWHPRAA